MNIRKPYYREFRRRFYETLGDKGDSILRYRGADNKEHYIASGNSPDVKPGGGMVETTWQELKDKRDAGKLIPGSLYRITDYQCTTTQENTRSAGHQFDIVLLALSEDKLAEEGWAMMHENIYDVTFGDGVAKCYLFLQPDGYYTLVDVNTKLGMNNLLSADLVIDEGKKAINAEAYYKTNLNTANLTYNYFQNSNLSAWKVWYCLDNDKSRFAWADATNGKGVIYRLIDEWNNDVPYDFKNIQLYLPIVDGEYDSDGEKSWVYTFCLYNNDMGTYEDGSLKIIEVSVDDTYIVFSNIFMAANFDLRRQHKIKFNVALGNYSLSNEEGSTPQNCIYVSCSYAIIIDSDTFLYHCVQKDFIAQSSGIYYYTKKVLTES